VRDRIDAERQSADDGKLALYEVSGQAFSDLATVVAHFARAHDAQAEVAVVIGDFAADIEDRGRVLNSAQERRVSGIPPGNDVDAQALQPLQFLLGNDGSALLKEAIESFLVESAGGELLAGSVPCCRDIFLEEFEQHFETDGADALHAAEGDPVREFVQ
jgi:hypothetical protein